MIAKSLTRVGFSLGGGKRDANRNRSGYDINLCPALTQTVIPFLDGS